MNVFRKVYINPSKSRFLCHTFYSKFQNDTENINGKSILAYTQANEDVSALLQKHAKGEKSRTYPRLRNNIIF